MKSYFCQPLLPARRAHEVSELDWIRCWEKSELWPKQLKHWNPLDWNHLKAANEWAHLGCHLPHKTQPYIGLLLPDQQTEIKFALRSSLRKKPHLFQTDCVSCFTPFCPGTPIDSCPKLDHIPVLSTTWYDTSGWPFNQRGCSTVVEISLALRMRTRVLLWDSAWYGCS